jgi:hypothetical protein
MIAAHAETLVMPMYRSNRILQKTQCVYKYTMALADPFRGRPSQAAHGQHTTIDRNDSLNPYFSICIEQIREHLIAERLYDAWWPPQPCPPRQHHAGLRQARHRR